MFFANLRVTSNFAFMSFRPFVRFAQKKLIGNKILSFFFWGGEGKEIIKMLIYHE